jgi:polyphenol oxidase
LSPALYRSALLDALPWLEHGFGTRQSVDWPPETERVRVKQIHSDIVWRAGAHPGCAGEGDALVSNAPGLYLTIRTADCLPLLLAAPDVRAVAAVHAGWRGTAANIAGKAVEKLQAEFGAAPENLVAAIGPGVGQCCYEVGEEVLERFTDYGEGIAEGRRLHLAEVNRRQLSRAGVQQIDIFDMCTFCLPEVFHSFRRDRERAGRLVSAIRVRT